MMVYPTRALSSADKIHEKSLHGLTTCASSVLLPQVLLNTTLPTIPGAASGRMHYTPAHSSHHQQQHQQHQQVSGSAGAAAGRAAAGAAPLPNGGAAAQGQAHTQHAAAVAAHHAGVGGALSQAAGLSGVLNPQHLTPAFNTPLSALSGLYRSGSPALAAAIGAQTLLHSGSIGQPSLLGPGQQMTLFSCADTATVDPYGLGLNGGNGLLGWPFVSAGLPALAGAAGQQFALSSGVLPLLHTPQQQQLQQLQQSHFLGLQQQQLFLQQQGLAAALAAGGQQMSQGMLQQPLGVGLGPAAGLLMQQQQQWLSFLQQPPSAQNSGQQQPGG